MLTRFHKILIGLLVVQLALTVLVLARDDDAAELEQRPILAQFDAAKVTRLQVASAGGVPLELVKRDESWVLASSYDHPVMTSKVADLLASLAKLSAASPIATQASRHKQLRVADDDYERKLTLTADGKDTTLLVGSAAGSRRNALRLAGDARVFAVSGLAAWSIGAAPREWVDPAYVRVPRDEIGKLSIERGGKTIALARASAGEAWALSLDGKPVALAASESLDTAAIDELVAAASSIDLDEPADPKRTASPTATITIERLAANATVAPVVLDVIDDGASYWVRQRGVERAALVTKASLDKLVAAERGQLVKHEAPATTQSKAAGRGARSG